MPDRKSWMLATVSTAATLLCCEAGLRLFVQPAGKPAPPPRPVYDQKDLRVANRYVQSMPAAAGVDRAWFLADPPPVPRTRPAPDETARYNDFVRRNLYAPQAQYLWNRQFVSQSACDPVFTNFPPVVRVFDPPGGDSHPRYRFPPSATLPSGLVTNRFGLRGPEIELAKPPRTIRIAFVGASTTIHVHSHLYSYPERVGDWLNRWAQANRLDVRFEALNAGREGIRSTDIAAIVRDELVPLDLDLVVYYEGANQFLDSAARMAKARLPGRTLAGQAGEWLRQHTALGTLVARSLAGRSTDEPNKPWHYLDWPAGVDANSPDVDSPALPLLLPVAVHDLDTIGTALRPTGARLLLASFAWLAGSNLRISERANRYVWWHLNEVLAPLTYAETRQLADFQNLVFRRYAASRGVQFLDIAGAMPQDPDLFSDAIHLRDPGERLKAWIFFQQLAPLVQREIEAGRLPHRAPAGTLPPPPSLAVSQMELRCPGR